MVYSNITVNFENKTGKIKPMNGVGQPPFVGIDTSYFKYLKEANIPYSRLHDVGGRFGGNLFVDIPNIFRDFDADENDPASYDFAFTDIIISNLIKNGCMPIYRLGVSIEHTQVIKVYRINPPKDFKKWAIICEHIIMHYNEGWADGFNYGIKYWEIWNEPDCTPHIEKNDMWKGTREQYFDLYRVTSGHLKERFGDSIKIGGYASCGFYWVNTEHHISGEAFGTSKPLNDWEERIYYFIEFFNEFIKMVKNENLPLDFFGYHSYEGVKNTVNMQRYAEKRFAEAGLGNVEIQLNEWNTNPHKNERNTSKACADTAAMMCAMQNTDMNLMCYYDARIGISVYGGLFDPLDIKPSCTYYSFKAFGELLKLGAQTECQTDIDELYAVAASDGTKHGVLISNINGNKIVTTNLDSTMNVYLIDENNYFEKINTKADRFIMDSNQVIYICNYLI